MKIQRPLDILGRLIVPSCYVAYAKDARLAILRVHATVPKKEGYYHLLGVDMDGYPQNTQSDNCVVVQL